MRDLVQFALAEQSSPIGRGIVMGGAQILKRLCLFKTSVMLIEISEVVQDGLSLIKLVTMPNGRFLEDGMHKGMISFTRQNCCIIGP